MNIKVVVYVCLLLLTGCGGGSSGGNAPGNNLSSSSATSSATPAPLTAITGQTAARLAGAFFDTLSLVQDPSQFSPQYNLPDGKKSGQCDGTGSYEIIVSNNGKKIVESYNNCYTFVYITENTGKDVTLSGKQTSIHSNTNQDIIQYSWEKFSVTDGRSTEILNGNAELKSSPTQIIAEVNASVENATQGKLYLNNIVIAVEKNSTDAPGLIPKITNAAGAIRLENVASANIQYSAADSKIILSGINSSLKIYEEQQKINIDLDNNNDNVIDAAISLAPDIIDTLSEKSLYTNTIPMAAEATNYVRLNSLKLKPFSLKEKFTHPSGHVISIQLEFIEGNESDLQRIDATSFALKNPVSKEYTTYRFYAYAIDAFGNQSQKQDITVHISADTDEDGEYDIYDSDDDNDGVSDRDDAFPLDLTESKDTDGDGIGDNKDPDIDNDSILNGSDAYPVDHNCSISEDGDGKRCFQTIMSPQVLFTDKDGIFYIRSVRKNIDNIRGNHDIIKWDSKSQRVIEVAENIIPEDFVQGMYSASSHQFLFHLQGSHIIYQYNPVTDEVKNYFDNQNRILSFTLEKNYLVLTVIDSNSDIFYESYNANGELISKTNWLFDINGLASAIVFRNQELVPFCKISLTLDEHGNFIEIGDRTQRWDDPCNNGYEKAISIDGTFAVLSGIYDKSGAEVAKFGGWDLGIHNAWTPRGFSYASYTNGQFELNVINPYGEKLFNRALPAGNYEPHTYFSNGKIIVLSYQAQGGVRIGVYDQELNPLN